MNLQSLPNDIIQNISSYLPQNAKANLMYTNFHFYSVVQPTLYEKIMITRSAMEKSSNTFRDSLFSVVGFLETPLATDELNNKIFQLRQEILLQSLQCNSNLLVMIKEIVVYGLKSQDGSFSSVESIIIPELLDFISINCKDLLNFTCLQTSISNIMPNTAKTVDIHCNLHLENLMVNYEHSKRIKELFIEDRSFSLDLSTFNQKNLLNLLTNLETLILRDERSQVIVLDFLLKNYTKDKKVNWKNCKLHHYHGVGNESDKTTTTVQNFLKCIDFELLKRLELEVGCEEMVCDCMEVFLNNLNGYNLSLKSISFIQRTVHRDHNYSEKFDFYITNFLSKLPDRRKLNYLSIRHSYPLDFMAVNGFEGNYLHRIEMYKELLPKLSQLRTLVVPSFMQTLACYEQLMSDLLWNGCECETCKDYASIFDDYVQNHKYFLGYSGTFVDMFTAFLFGTSGHVCASKMVNNCDLFPFKYPSLVNYWDFHSGGHEIEHMDEYVECNMDKTAFKPIMSLIDHFLIEYVKIIGELSSSVENVHLSGFWYGKSNGLGWHLQT
ncbi:Roy1 protein [Martiniozyma asiatica (nom. inval.)]|nr:Roy1 protein [Martiniozyma asiatica]